MLFGALQRKPGLHLGRPRTSGRQGQLIPELSRRFLILRGLPGCLQARDCSLQGLLPGRNIGLCPGQRGTKPFALAHGAPQHRVQMAQPFGHGRQSGIRFVEPLQGGIRAFLGLGPACLGGGECKPVPLKISAYFGEPRLGVVDGGLHLQQRRCTRRAAPDGECSEDIARPCHDRQAGLRADERRRRLQILGNGSSSQQPAQKDVHQGARFGGVALRR
ncbi:hypothetical protein D9M72_452040 [compost metagenome]